MRLIGHLPNEQTAVRFGDFLYVEGIANEVEAEKEGWAVWIQSEDDVERAKVFLQSYLENPEDPKFRKHARKARKLKEREQQEAVAAEKRYFDRTRLLRATLPYGPGPFTLFLIVTCVGLWVYSLRNGTPAALLISEDFYRRDLPEVLHGQVWRLFTPALLHGGLLHLFFNMLWLFDLGSMIEGRQGSGRFLALMLVLALLSNLGQYFLAGPNFVGMSGVVYGLLGYIWMKGRFDPSSGLFLHPQTVTMMLVWFFLCFTGWLGNIANGAHATGLVAGIAWGYLASRPWGR